MNTNGGSALIKSLELEGVEVIFGLPGAYTPTCSAKHVPGYVESAEALIDRQQILVLENLCRRPSASGDACIKGRDGWHAGNASTGPYTAPQPARMDP